MLSRRGLVAGGLATPFLARSGFAQSDWPKGPLRWIVGLYQYQERYRQQIQLGDPQQAQLADLGLS